MHKISARLRTSNALRAGALGAIVPLLALIAPGAASASKSQVAIFQDGGVTSSPSQTLREIRHLGAGMVRIQVNWSSIAPSPTAKTEPKFNATDPGSYPSANWANLDGAVRTANADGIKVLLTVTGGAPTWAEGPGKPGGSAGAGLAAWKPSPALFGQFVKAVATRYSGHYRGLPAVRYWEIFNEPNFIEELAPVNQEANMYRGLVNAAWPALRGHGTVLLGGLAAYNTGMTPPLTFVRELYCVGTNYKPLRGGAARQQGCTGGLRQKNPALFSATGFSIHPYPLSSDINVPPNRTRLRNANDASFVQLPNFIRNLDRSVGGAGSGKRFGVWNDEYGYISNPPNGQGVSLANQAYYLNWAEYLTYKNPRLVSFEQFLLTDPAPPSISHSGFDSGLIGYSSNALAGKPKPAYDAWRLPLYLPVTSGHKGKALEVWGCVRPAQYAVRDTHKAQKGLVQFAPAHSSTFATVATVTLGNANGSCYFDLHLKFPSSGTVRLAYSYPLADTGLLPTFALGYSDPLSPSVSRTIPITIR